MAKRTFPEIVEAAAAAMRAEQFRLAAQLYRSIRWYEAALYCDQRALAERAGIRD